MKTRRTREEETRDGAFEQRQLSKVTAELDRADNPEEWERLLLQLLRLMTEGHILGKSEGSSQIEEV